MLRGLVEFLLLPHVDVGQFPPWLDRRGESVLVIA
jgi:hypothetical protein